MGGGYYSPSLDRADTASRALTNRIMTHAADVSSGRAEAKVHENLDPSRKNREGKIIRESFDSGDHPNSVPIAIFLDTTGSMSRIPSEIVLKLPDLMDLIITRKYLQDPQVLFGAVNDATTNCIAALEAGQFESNQEMSKNLSNILVTQGGGGGTSHESYEMAMYFMAYHTDLDCVKKRNRKGYFFIVGDEMPYDFVSKHEVKKYIGVDIQADIPLDQVLTALRAKFNVFWLFPAAGAAHSNDQVVIGRLKDLFGEGFVLLPDSSKICPAIAAIIGVGEGRDPRTVAAELKEGLASDVQAADISQIVSSVTPRRIDDI